MQRADAARASAVGSLERLALLARDGDDRKALARQPRGDGEADAAAGAGDDDVIHGARAFPRRSSAIPRRSERTTGALCAGRAARQAARMSRLRSLVRGHALAQHDFGDDERAGDRVLAREDAARAHRRMRVERRLDLFGVNLGAADVDDRRRAGRRNDSDRRAARPCRRCRRSRRRPAAAARRRRDSAAPCGSSGCAARRRRPSSRPRRPRRSAKRESRPGRRRPRRRRPPRSRRRRARRARAG